MKISDIFKLCIISLILIFTIEPLTIAQTFQSNSYKKYKKHHLSNSTKAHKQTPLALKKNTVSQKSKNTYSINEQAKIKEINIKGNFIIDKEEILKNLEVGIGDKCNLQAIKDSLKNIYSIGYFTDSMKAVTEPNPDGTINLNIELKEYPLIKDVIFEGNTVVSNGEIEGFLNPLKGKPQNINNINKAIKSIEENYAAQGYILARVDKIKEDPDGTVSLHINEGEIESIKISGNTKTKNYIITRNMQVRAGSVYNENFLKEDLVRLYATQIFKDVNREIHPSERNPEKYDVTVVVKEQRTGAISISGGIDSYTGIFGNLGIEKNNFRGLNQRVAFNALSGYNAIFNIPGVINHVNLQTELSFFEPHFLNADNSLMNKVYFRDFASYQIPFALEKRIGGEIMISHKIKERENLTGTFSLGAEKIDLQEGDLSRISNIYSSNNLNMSERTRQLQGGIFLSMDPGLIYDTRDSKILPRKGVLASVRANEVFNAQGFDTSYGTLTGVVKKYYPVGKKSTFSITAKGGSRAWGTMPEVMAFGLGGPYSVRGFYMNGVGTGNQFFMGSAEFATPVPLLNKLKLKFADNVRMTLFVDAGKVFNGYTTNTIYDRPMQALTAGVGLKFFIPGVGPMSIDYGIPLLNPGSYNSQKGYVTFGMGEMMY